MKATEDSQAGNYKFYTSLKMYEPVYSTQLIKNITFEVSIVYVKQKPCYETKIAAVSIRN